MLLSSGRTGVCAGQWRWRWDLNPRKTCAFTRFRVLRTTVHRRPSASVACANTTRSATGERWRTGVNETRTETRRGSLLPWRPRRWTGLIAAGAVVTGRGSDSCCMRSRLAPTPIPRGPADRQGRGPAAGHPGDGDRAAAVQVEHTAVGASVWRTGAPGIDATAPARNSRHAAAWVIGPPWS